MKQPYNCNACGNIIRGDFITSTIDAEFMYCSLICYNNFYDLKFKVNVRLDELLLESQNERN